MQFSFARKHTKHVQNNKYYKTTIIMVKYNMWSGQVTLISKYYLYREVYHTNIHIHMFIYSLLIKLLIILRINDNMYIYIYVNVYILIDSSGKI
jgi:hypothetical protein